MNKKNGKKKKIIIISIIIILVISFGIIYYVYDYYKFKNTPDARAYDLNLNIKLNKDNCSLSEKDLVVYITLSNVKGSPVKILLPFVLGGLLDVDITNPHNIKLEPIIVLPDYEHKKIVLKPNEKLKFKFSIFDIEYFTRDEETYQWKLGNYTIKFRYYSDYFKLDSNVLQFQITE